MFVRNLRIRTYLIFLIAGSTTLFTNCSSNGGGNGIPQTTSSQPGSVDVTAQIALKSLTYSAGNLPVFLSSNYFPGIGSDAGRSLYLQDFPTHNIVRVNAFDAAVVLSDACVPNSGTDYSNCVTQFQTALVSASNFLTYLTQLNKTQILMVNIFRTPSWLSIHPDATSACGGGKLGQSYRPKDYAVWQQLLQITANFFKSVEASAGGTKIYYQFWNEPDLACNWQESTAAFLQLYSKTMPYLKTLHTTSKVGGAETESWAGKVAFDGQSRPQNLNFDLIQFVKEQSLPMDFVSFHYFSTDYENDFINAVTQYRIFKQGQGFTEAQMPVMLTEWLPQVGNPNGYNSNQAADAANLFLAFDQANLWGQGGVPFQDYGTQAYDQWGTISYPDAIPKPIFYVYQFFDAISRSSKGINYSTESIYVDVPNSTLQSKFKVGERKRIFAQLQMNTCFKFGSWNRLASAQDAALAFLLGEGVTLADLQSAYGKDPTTMISNLLAAIKASHPFDLRWTTAFANANIVYVAADDMNTNKEFSYDLSFSDFMKVSAASGQSLGRKGIYTQSAQLIANGNHLLYSLLPQEVLLAQICF